MPSLGTRKFMIPFTSGAKPEQVLKEAGYVSVTLHSVFYNSRGNIWQRIFGGSDQVALTSAITYQSGEQRIEAQAVQDSRQVKANREHHIALSRLIALKVPATADGLELKIAVNAVKGDNLQAGLDLLNDDQFKPALELSPVSVGQIGAVTGFLKKVFSGIDDPAVLEATYAGIVSTQQVAAPVEKERLTTGYLAVVSNEDDDSSFVQQIDQDQLTVVGDGLRYNDKPVTHTHVVYAITCEPRRGTTTGSPWSVKYSDALRKMDDLYVSTDTDRRIAVLQEAKALWLEGNALLYNDPTYIRDEMKDIKAEVLREINDIFAKTDPSAAPSPVTFAAALGSLQPHEVDFVEADAGPELVVQAVERAEAYVKTLGVMGLAARFG